MYAYYASIDSNLPSSATFLSDLRFGLRVKAIYDEGLGRHGAYKSKHTFVTGFVIFEYFGCFSEPFHRNQMSWWNGLIKKKKMDNSILKPNQNISVLIFPIFTVSLRFIISISLNCYCRIVLFKVFECARGEWAERTRHAVVNDRPTIWKKKTFN